MNWYKLSQSTAYGYRGISNPQQILKTGFKPSWVFQAYQFQHSRQEVYNGLSKQAKTTPWLFIATRVQDAKQYGPVVIRFPMPQDAITSPGTNGIYRISKQTISPSVMQFDKGAMQGGYHQQWLPLSNINS